MPKIGASLHTPLARWREPSWILILVHPVFVACLAAALSVIAYMMISGYNSRPIGSDGWGYYLPLPAIFIYGDLNLTFLNAPDLPPDVAQYRFPDGSYQGLSPFDTGYRNKYAVGTAVLQLPFFLIALTFTKLTQPNVNGFELPFQLATAFSGAFYLALGCYFAYRATRLRYGPLAAGLAVAFALLATNLLYYGSFEGSFSHVYGFCLIAALLYLTIRRIELGGTPSVWEFALFGFVAGAAVMVRPTNGVAALLYLPFAQHASSTRAAFGMLVAFAASALAALPQMLLWLKTTGQLIYYSYQGEGFNFLDPQLSDYLLSVSKGVFFWHAAYLVMMLTLIAQLRVRPFETLIMILIVALNLYLGASWGDPLFGDSFGCRQVVEMTPILILSTAATIEWIAASGVWRCGAAAFGLLLVAINLTQFYGYMAGALPHSRTTMDQYRTFWIDRMGLAE